MMHGHSIKVDLNCLDPGNVHLNAPVLNVLTTMHGQNHIKSQREFWNLSAWALDSDPGPDTCQAYMTNT